MQANGCGISLLASSLVLALASQSGTAQAEERVTVRTVHKVYFGIEQSDPPNIEISAIGEVPTGGYTEPTLTPVVYKMQPPDGIQDFTFTAIKPDGIVTQAVTKISARYVWNRAPDWVKGVRIHGEEDGVKTVMLKMQLKKERPDPVSEEETVTVPEILKVQFDIPKMDPTNVVMEVVGQVPTGGYTDPQLIMVQYFRQPEDGIQDFTFTARKPDGIVTQAFTKISARHVWQGGVPEWVKGVRIHGVGKGVKTVMLDKGDEPPKKPGPARDVTLNSTYLTQAVAGAHQIRLEITGLKTTSPTGKLTLDRNSCTLNAFGDTEACTKAFYFPLDVTLQQLRLADPSGQGRPIYRVEGDKLPEGVEFSLIGPGKKGGDYRLVVRQEDRVTHVVPLSAAEPK